MWTSNEKSRDKFPIKDWIFSSRYAKIFRFPEDIKLQIGPELRSVLDIMTYNGNLAKFGFTAIEDVEHRDTFQKVKDALSKYL